jgi:hypothetical protein
MTQSKNEEKIHSLIRDGQTSPSRALYVPKPNCKNMQYQQDAKAQDEKLNEKRSPRPEALLLLQCNLCS